MLFVDVYLNEGVMLFFCCLFYVGMWIFIFVFKYGVEGSRFRVFVVYNDFNIFVVEKEVSNCLWVIID